MLKIRVNMCIFPCCYYFESHLLLHFYSKPSDWFIKSNYDKNKIISTLEKKLMYMWLNVIVQCYVWLHTLGTFVKHYLLEKFLGFWGAQLDRKSHLISIYF